MTKTLCWGDDDEIMCYWQTRFWQAYKILTLEQREEVANMPYGGEEE